MYLERKKNSECFASVYMHVLSLPFLTPAEIRHKPVDIDRPAENKEREGLCFVEKKKKKGKKK